MWAYPHPTRLPPTPRALTIRCEWPSRGTSPRKFCCRRTRLRQVDLSALPKVFGQRGQDPVEHALALPLREAIVAVLVRRVTPRQVRPRRSRWKRGRITPTEQPRPNSRSGQGQTPADARASARC